GRLGVDLLAANATLDDDRVLLTSEQVTAHLEQVQRLVRTSGADLGVLFDATGERVRLVDETGRIIGMPEAPLAYLALVARAMPYPRIAVPVSTSRPAAEIVRRSGGESVWTPIAAPAVMAADEAPGGGVPGAE